MSVSALFKLIVTGFRYGLISLITFEIVQDHGGHESHQMDQDMYDALRAKMPLLSAVKALPPTGLGPQS